MEKKSLFSMLISKIRLCVDLYFFPPQASGIAGFGGLNLFLNLSCVD
jgi:hypothetical protein